MRCGGLLACRGSEALVNISRPRQIASDYQQGEYLADQGTHRVARIEDMQFADKLRPSRFSRSTGSETVAVHRGKNPAVRGAAPRTSAHQLLQCGLKRSEFAHTFFCLAKLGKGQGAHLLAVGARCVAERQHLADARQAEAHGSRRADELRALQAGGIVQPLAAGRIPGRLQKPKCLIMPKRLHGHGTMRSAPP